jgi:hypothetical protein
LVDQNGWLILGDIQTIYRNCTTSSFLLQQLVGKTTNSKKTRKTKPPGLEEINFHKTRSNKNQELQQTIIK